MKNVSLPTRSDLIRLGLAVLGAAMMSPRAEGQINEDLKLLPADGSANDRFGGSVAVSGTTAVVGAAADDDNGSSSGSAYVFDVTSGQQLVKLLPTDGAASDSFGYSVAVSGTIAVVGAPEDDVNGPDSGSAYVFDVTTGQQIAKLLPTDGEASDSFGSSVAVSGALAVVGARFDDDNGSESGSAYLFDVITGKQIMKLLPKDGDEFDYFGWSVAVSETAVVVGAHGDDDDGPSSGSAYVFDVGTGQQVSKLLPADGSAGATIGFSVAVSGATAVVGAFADNDNGIQSGSAYLFDVRTGQQLAKLLPADGAAGDWFGVSVSISGTAAVVGVLHDSDNGPDAGSSYVFHVPSGKEIAKLLPSDGAEYDNFGSSVALSGTTVLVGAPHADEYGPGSGSAYVFATPQPWKLNPLNGHWYRETDPFSWKDAESQSTAWGGHLATVRDQAENDWLASTFAGDGAPIWIGYNDAAVEGTFVWSSGETPGYENWRAGEPDDLNGADWAALVPSVGTWVDETFLPERRGVVEVISDDCDGNNLPDAYEIAIDPTLDWNGDGVLDACVSANYCVAENNSTGVPAVIGAGGSPIASENAFTLEAWDLPLNEFAYFLASESTTFIPGFGGSSGNLCVGAPQYRFNVAAGGGKILNSGATGTVSFTLDLNLLPQGITFDPGETWFFQLWYRDFIASGPTSNTTDGIEVMLR